MKLRVTMVTTYFQVIGDGQYGELFQRERRRRGEVSFARAERADPTALIFSLPVDMRKETTDLVRASSPLSLSIPLVSI